MGGDYTAYCIPGDYDTQEIKYTRSRLSGVKSRMESASSAELIRHHL